MRETHGVSQNKWPNSSLLLWFSLSCHRKMLSHKKREYTSAWQETLTRKQVKNPEAKCTKVFFVERRTVKKPTQRKKKTHKLKNSKVKKVISGWDRLLSSACVFLYHPCVMLVLLFFPILHLLLHHRLVLQTFFISLCSFLSTSTHKLVWTWHCTTHADLLCVLFPLFSLKISPRVSFNILGVWDKNMKSSYSLRSLVSPFISSQALNFFKTLRENTVTSSHFFLIISRETANKILQVKGKSLCVCLEKKRKKAKRTVQPENKTVWKPILCRTKTRRREKSNWHPLLASQSCF